MQCWLYCLMEPKWNGPKRLLSHPFPSFPILSLFFTKYFQVAQRFNLFRFHSSTWFNLFSATVTQPTMNFNDQDSLLFFIRTCQMNWIKENYQPPNHRFLWFWKTKIPKIFNLLSGPHLKFINCFSLFATFVDKEIFRNFNKMIRYLVTIG